MGIHSEITLSVPSNIVKAGDRIEVKAFIHNKSHLTRSFTVFNSKYGYRALKFKDEWRSILPNRIGIWTDAFFVPFTSEPRIAIVAESWTVNDTGKWVFDDRTTQYLILAPQAPAPISTVQLIDQVTRTIQIATAEDVVLPGQQPPAQLIDTVSAIISPIVEGEGGVVSTAVELDHRNVTIFWVREEEKPLPGPGEGPEPEPEVTGGIPAWFWILITVLVIAGITLIAVSTRKK